jgi:hypothetical protein
VKKKIIVIQEDRLKGKHPGSTFSVYFVSKSSLYGDIARQALQFDSGQPVLRSPLAQTHDTALVRCQNTVLSDPAGAASLNKDKERIAKGFTIQGNH